ncbi:MAG: hypothetical protein Q8O42_14400 [Acidobacteriota bacterium]|nr:hypothetical protein [Acidobacteriota bacterium]
MTALLTFLAFSLVAAAAAAQTPANQTPSAPDFRVEVWGSALVEFTARMDAYAKLRESLSAGIPRLAITDHPAEILKAETALAERIRQARAKAKRGDIFSSRIRAAVRRALAGVIDAGMCEAIRDDNPGEFFYAVNATYPKQRAVSTVPPSVLGVLPALPDDVMYRFLDEDLILHDTRANVILDRIDDAIKCRR